MWFASITEEEKVDLERIQKNVCKLILKNEYTTYKEALKTLELECLNERRYRLAKKFGEGCVKLDEMRDLFPKAKISEHDLRKTNKYQVKFASTARLYNSAVPTLQRMLNS